MIKYFAIILLIISTSCIKKNNVFYCGDHICKNKKESEAYFKKNLSLEIVVKNKKKDEPLDLIRLNRSDSLNTSKNDIKAPLFRFINKKKNGVINEDKNTPMKDTKNIKKTTSNNKLYKFLNTERPKKNVSDVRLPKKESNVIVKKKLIEKKDSSSDIKKPQLKEKKIFENVKKISKNYCSTKENCDIDVIAKKIIDSSKKDKYPDINSFK